MPRNGSGTYSLPEAAFVFDTVISETAVNSNFSDLATALTGSVAKNGETTPTANLPMGGFKHTGVATGAALTDYADVKSVQNAAYVWAGTAGGTADAITLTPSPAITAYVTGQHFFFQAGAANNTGAATLAISGLAAKAIEKNDTALAADAIIANKYYIALYDGTAFQVTQLGGAEALTSAAIGVTVQGYDAGISTTPLTEGLHTIFVPAAAMRPTVSNGCAIIADIETTAGRPDLQVLDFDASSDEHAQFQIAMPKSWDEGTVTFQVWWTSTATDTDGVSWALQGVACSDGDTADVAYGTAVVVDDANQSTAEDVYVSAVSDAVTIAGTPAAGDICFFRIFRDVSDANDTATEDARLIGVQILYTIDAGNDA